MGKRQRGQEKAATFGQLRFKRVKKEHAPNASPISGLTFEQALPEDIMIKILSFLDAHELAVVSLVSSEWARMAKDPQLWRALYLSTYAPKTASPSRTRPWRDLYKISTNWRRGAARATSVSSELRKAILPPAPSTATIDEDDNVASTLHSRHSATGDSERDTLLQFHQHFYLTATRSTNAVQVYRSTPEGDSLHVETITSQTAKGHITELRLDDEGCLLFVGYKGGFSLFDLTLSDEAVHAVEYTTMDGATTETVMLASLRQDMLATVSSTFTVRFWQVDRRKRRVREVARPHTSQQQFCPVFLSLDPVLYDDINSGMKVTLAFSTPVFYPSHHWTVALQRFTVSFSSSPGTIETSHILSTTPLSLTASGLITSLSLSGSTLLASRDNNTIELYTVTSDELVHERTLWGHTSSVRDVAMLSSSGRAVSVADDGWKVWESLSPSSAQRVVDISVARERVKRVWFDDEKIVGLVQGEAGQQDRIRVLRFD